MSARNGDKARFGRLRRQKILLRKCTREMRDAMYKKTNGMAIVAPAGDRTTSLPPGPISAEVGKVD